MKHDPHSTERSQRLRPEVSRTVTKHFVPEGLDERSDSTELAEVLAVYCLETVKKSVPSL
jgi:hypothetical protein